MLDRLDTEMALSRNALNLRGYRQELLASNIANSDTPHYKARDIDFKAVLAEMVSGQGPRGPLGLAKTAERHLNGEQDNALSGFAKYRSEYQGAADGNTVNMDIERSAFTENSVHMEALLNFINSKFRTLQSALQSQ